MTRRSFTEGRLDNSGDPVEFQKEIDDFMANYDEKEAERRRRILANQVDEDGFTKVLPGRNIGQDFTVIHSWRKPPKATGAFKHPFATLAAGVGDQPSQNRRKKKPKEHLSFYRFQARETARKELFKRRFTMKQDDKMVENMRKSKKFKVMPSV